MNYLSTNAHTFKTKHGFFLKGQFTKNVNCYHLLKTIFLSCVEQNEDI